MTGRRLAFDIETDGLIPQMTCIHSLVMVDVDTGEGWSACASPSYVSPLGYKRITIYEGLKMLMEASQVIGHNIINFDIPAIQKIYDWFFIGRDAILDTLLLSRLIWPNIRENDFRLRGHLKSKIERTVPQEHRRQYDKETDTWSEDTSQQYINDTLKAKFPGNLIGSHGLEAWGYRLGEWKGDYAKEMKARGLDPWAHWNVEMQEYCEQDVTVTLKLLAKCEEKAYSPVAIAMEHAFAFIINQMERWGFPFHIERAQKLQAKLMKRHAELSKQLKEAFPPIEDKWTFVPKANNSKYGYVKGQPIEKSEWTEFNPSSRQHIARWLKKQHGWEPKEFTPEGQAKVDEAILKKLPYPEAKLLVEYFLLDKRLGMLENPKGGLIPAAVMNGEGVYCIHGGVSTIGAVTRRCTHSKPNMAQIPANNVPFGKDFRGLMYAPAGWTLVGWDASGLELRCFAHYMARYDGGEYIKIVLDGDIHWAHAKALELVGQDEEYDEHNPVHDHARNKVAKRFIYAFLYGAGALKIGEIVVPTGSDAAKKKAGTKLINTFLKRVPALKRLKKDLKIAVTARKGKLFAIDGGEMHVRSEHSALNTLLQSAGAIVVKKATIIFYDLLVAAGLRPGIDFRLCAHVHDEVQVMCRPQFVDIVGKAAEDAMVEAGVKLGFKCPLAADYKPGENWSETH
jgi:DNA polymerase I-like protein with 3'-5' exonuclease and polymerase domains